MEIFVIIIILLFVAYSIIGVVKVSWLFLNKSPLSPHFVRHPSFTLVFVSVFYQPILKIILDFTSYKHNQTTFLALFTSILKFLLPLLILFSILFLIFK